jgi:hypothetical protein
MGADKNSFPKRERGLYPEFTTKDSHTSLPRSHSHNGPTNPRNKPQTIPKRKHDQEAKDLVVLQQPWQTVRDPGADGPLNVTERPHEHPTTRTVRTWSSDGPRATRATRMVRDHWADGPRSLRRRSDKPLPARTRRPNESKRRRTHDEHEEP